MTKTDVILTNPCGATGEAVASSLRSEGLTVRIMEAPSAKKREDLYLKTLRSFLEEHPAEMVIPVFFPEVLSAHREEFPDVIIPLDSAEKIIRLDDKISACSLAASVGVPQPKIFSSVEEVCDFPVVVKRPRGQGGDSVYFPHNAKALGYLTKTASSFLLTEYIEGYNCSVDAVRWDGYFHAEAYRVLLPEGKGVSRLRESIVDERLVGYARRILDSVDYHGVCGVDFRIDREGNPFFLECNPRFSGGLESALASGFNLPYIYYCLAKGMPVPEVHFLPGVRTGEVALLG